MMRSNTFEYSATVSWDSDVTRIWSTSSTAEFFSPIALADPFTSASSDRKLRASSRPGALRASNQPPMRSKRRFLTRSWSSSGVTFAATALMPTRSRTSV